MGEFSFGTRREQSSPEDIEAANILLLLRKRTDARNIQSRASTSFITHNAPYASAHAQLLQIQQHPIVFQQPDVRSLPASYHFSFVPTQPFLLPQTYYRFLANTPSCYVGPTRADAEPHPPLSPVTFKDNHMSTSDELAGADEKPPSGDTTCESGANKKRPLSDSSEKPEAKRKRKNLTKEQVRTLEETYSRVKYPPMEERMKLQGPTELSEARIQVWFQNRRAKERRKLETKMGRLRGSEEKSLSTKRYRLKDDNENSEESRECSDEETPETGAEEHLGNSNGQVNHNEEGPLRKEDPL